MMAMFVDNLHVGSFMGHTVRVYGHSYEQNRYVIDKSGDKLPLTGGNCPGGGLSGGKCPTLDKLPPPSRRSIRAFPKLDPRRTRLLTAFIYIIHKV